MDSPTDASVAIGSPDWHDLLDFVFVLFLIACHKTTDNAETIALAGICVLRAVLNAATVFANPFLIDGQSEALMFGTHIGILNPRPK